MNTPNPAPTTVGAVPWYTSPVYIGALVTVISTLATLAPKAANALGLTTPGAIQTSVQNVFGVIALLSGIFTALKRQSSTVQPLTLTQAQADIHPATKQVKGQAGFFTMDTSYLLIGTAGVVLFLMNGCASTTAANTVNQSLLAAATLNNTVVTTVDSLVKSKSVTSEEATAALAITDDIDAALALANTAAQAGESSTVTAKLAAITTALTAVQTCLAAGNLPTTLSTCLQGVSPP
jgi:hypothetical protein